MSRVLFPRRLARLVATLLVSGVTSTTVLAEEADTATELKEKPVVQQVVKPYTSPNSFSDAESFYIYNILAGEMSRDKGDVKQAFKHYSLAALASKDESVSQQALELAMELGIYNDAQQIMDHWSQMTPDSLDVRQSRLLLKARQGKYDEALDDLVWIRDAIDKKEGHGFEYIVSLLALEVGAQHSLQVFARYADKIDSSPRVQLLLAHMALSAGDTDLVLKATQAIIEQGSKEQKEQAAHLQAKAFMAEQSEGSMENGLKALEPYVKDTKDDDLKLDYARLLIMLNRRDEATPWFKQLYASQPDNDAILYTLGLLYLEQEEYTFAEPLIKKLLDVPSRRYDANYFLGQIYEGQGRYKKALTAYEGALPNTHFFNEVMTRASQMVQKEKGVDEALTWVDQRLRSMTQDNNRQASILLIKAELLQGNERFNEALKVTQQAAELRPDHEDTVYIRALLHERLGDFEIAERDLRTIIESNDTNAFAYNALGYLLTTNTTRYEEALKLIEKAIELSPEEPAILDSLGWVQYRLGNNVDAEKNLRKALELFPDPEIASHLVEVLYKQGKQEEAKALLAKMLEQFPNDKLLTRVQQEVIGLK